MLEGVTHASERADEFRGMFVPAGSSVVTNIWYVHDVVMYSPRP